MQTAPASLATIDIRPTRYRWVVAALIFVVYTIAAADRANIGIVLPFIRQEFTISNTEAGALISLFFVFYSLGQIPFGFVCSRFGVSRVLPFFMVLTSAFTFLIGTAASPLMLKVYRAGLGIMEAPLPLSLLSTINNWFPSREKGTATGIFLAAAKFGPVIVPPWGSAHRSFRMAIGLLCLCRTRSLSRARLAPDGTGRSKDIGSRQRRRSRPYQNGAQPTATRPQRRARQLDLLDRLIRTRDITAVETAKAVFTSPNVWACAICYLLMTGVINVILAWLPTYLVTVKHFSLMNVGLVSSAPFVGAVLGNILGGMFSDRVVARRRKPTMIITAASSSIMLLLLIEAPNEVLAVSLLLFVTGLLLNVGYSSFSVYSMGLTTKKTYPIAASLVNAAGQAGGALAPFITGVLLDAYNWNAVFIFLAACSAATLAVLLIMLEPRPRVGGA